MDIGIVDVIIPCYNTGKYLGQTIEAVRAQTYDSFRITVVDDGSTDETRTVAKSYDPAVSYSYQENRGQAAARNRGIQRTSGEYVLLLDADDLILPDMVQTLVAYLERHPESDMCHSKVLAFNGEDPMHAYAENWRPFRFWEDYTEPLSVLCAIHGSSTLMRRRTFHRFGLFPEDRAIQGCEDWHFWLQCVLGGAVIGYVPRVLTLYRQHQTSSSSSERRIAARESELIRRTAGIFDAHGIDNPRKRLVLSYGMKAIALQWLAFDEKSAFQRMVALSRSIVSERAAASELERMFDRPDGGPASIRYLALCKALITMDQPELAAVMFLKSGDASHVGTEAAAFGQEQLFEFVVTSMRELVSGCHNRETPRSKPDEPFVRKPEKEDFFSRVAATVQHDASVMGYVQHQLAVVELSRGRGREAEHMLRASIALNPNYWGSRATLTRALAGQGRYSEAISSLVQAVELDSSSVVTGAMLWVLDRKGLRLLIPVFKKLGRLPVLGLLLGSIHKLMGKALAVAVRRR